MLMKMAEPTESAASEASPSRPATKVSVTPKAITANWPASTVAAWRAMLGRSADWSVRCGWGVVMRWFNGCAGSPLGCGKVRFGCVLNGEWQQLIFSAMPAHSRPWGYRDH